jgi:hypothetical protein
MSTKSAYWKICWLCPDALGCYFDAHCGSDGFFEHYDSKVSAWYALLIPLWPIPNTGTGFAESGIGPAWVLITSMFWTRKEQPLRMCIWQSCIGVSQLLGAGVSWGLGHAHGALKPWQLIFLVRIIFFLGLDVKLMDI